MPAAVAKEEPLLMKVVGLQPKEEVELELFEEELVAKMVVVMDIFLVEQVVFELYEASPSEVVPEVLLQSFLLVLLVACK